MQGDTRFSGHTHFPSITEKVPRHNICGQKKLAPLETLAKSPGNLKLSDYQECIAVGISHHDDIGVGSFFAGVNGDTFVDVVAKIIEG